MRRPSTRFHPEMIDNMFLVDHLERLRLIVKWFLGDKLSDQQLNRLLSDWWTHGGYAGDLDLPADFWPHLFRRAGFVTSEDNRVPPVEPLIIYRGCMLDVPLGCSWTTDVNVAAWFARRLRLVRKPAHVVRAIAPPEAVLGMFDARNESEIVVDPDLLLPDEHRIVPENVWRSPDVTA